jgi:hypothetical protein
MAKKLLLLTTALGVVAVMAAPALASAAPQLKGGGVALLVPAKVTATSSASAVTNPLKFETALGVAKCTSIMLGWIVTKNSATEGVEGGGVPSENTASGCTLGGTGFIMKEIAVLKIRSAASGSGTLELSYAWEIPGGVTCKFTNKGTPGALSYTAGKSVVTLKPTEIFSGNCGESTISGELLLETENGTAVTIG